MMSTQSNLLGVMKERFPALRPVPGFGARRPGAEVPVNRDTADLKSPEAKALQGLYQARRLFASMAPEDVKPEQFHQESGRATGLFGYRGQTYLYQRIGTVDEPRELLLAPVETVKGELQFKDRGIFVDLQEGQDLKLLMTRLVDTPGKFNIAFVSPYQETVSRQLFAHVEDVLARA